MFLVDDLLDFWYWYYSKGYRKLIVSYKQGRRFVFEIIDILHYNLYTYVPV